MLRRILLFLLSLVAWSAQATHNRAGEITFEYVGPYPALTYKITIITYTRTSSTQADRPSLDSVYFGDNSPFAVFYRTSKLNLGNDISKNTYIGYHTYPGNGTFVIRFEDPNRNEGVVNIPSSIDVPFYIESTLIIDPYRFPNNSPVLTYPPIDRGCVGRRFIHNANAYDPDGDSLSYELTVCRGTAGLPIPGYTFPNASFTLDSITGDLVWDAPIQPGEYNVAFKIVSWRRGVNLGYVVRDMQILIGNCSNLPPVIEPVNDTCVLAGDSIGFDVTAIDPNGHRVNLSATGGPFEVTNEATFTAIQFNNDTAISRFSWVTDCDNVRLQPYYVQFKAQDVVPLDSVSLVSLEGAFIRVFGPPPSTLIATASGNEIMLDWQPSGCPNVIGYRIYRRFGPYPGVIACPCDNGAPSYSGYSLLATIDSASILYYADNNNGLGLSVGVDYCYIVTAVYPDGAESCASPQACASLKRDLPVLTNVDVQVTDATAGSIYVAWSRPTELDTLLFPPPYRYLLKRSNGFAMTSSAPIAQFNDLDDTLYVDGAVNTIGGAFTYQVELLYTSSGVFVSKGNSTPASSIFLTLAPTDNRIALAWNLSVPWSNSRYDVFRSSSFNGTYDSLTTVSGTSYVDSNLVNGTEYCYFIRSVGGYSLSGLVDPIVNRSQRVCGAPFDNEPPCPPVLEINSSCKDRLNELVWTNPNNTCANDVVTYRIYYAPGGATGFELIDSVVGATDTFYVHNDLASVTGCYRVTAVDSVGNETSDPFTVCVDSCQQYVLPSVFTPNGDGVNDIFHPCDQTTSDELQQTNCPPYRNVRDVDMRIYNRWGREVFATTDRDINWDGKDQRSGSLCSEGTYYYTCKVNFFRLNGVETVELHGTVLLVGIE